MNLADLTRILEAEVHCGNDKLDCQVSYVCAGDLMSDLLVHSEPQALLITGLMNVQVIRTAEMLDFTAVVFIRGKTPNKAMTDLARQKGIALLTTPKTMYLSCGLLYEAGLKNMEIPLHSNEALP